jgi:hypothetical protein
VPPVTADTVTPPGRAGPDLAEALHQFRRRVGGLVRAGLGLDRDHGHVVGDDVVQLPGDPLPLFEQRRPMTASGAGSPGWSTARPPRHRRPGRQRQPGPQHQRRGQHERHQVHHAGAVGRAVLCVLRPQRRVGGEEAPEGERSVGGESQVDPAAAEPAGTGRGRAGHTCGDRLRQPAPDPAASGWQPACARRPARRACPPRQRAPGPPRGPGRLARRPGAGRRVSCAQRRSPWQALSCPVRGIPDPYPSRGCPPAAVRLRVAGHPRATAGAGRQLAPQRDAGYPAASVTSLDGHGIASAHIVGASLGGRIGQLLAVHHPQQVRTLTAIITTPMGVNAGPAWRPPSPLSPPRPW